MVTNLFGGLESLIPAPPAIAVGPIARKSPAASFLESAGETRTIAYAPRSRAAPEPSRVAASTGPSTVQSTTDRVVSAPRPLATSLGEASQPMLVMSPPATGVGVTAQASVPFLTPSNPVGSSPMPSSGVGTFRPNAGLDGSSSIIAAASTSPTESPSPIQSFSTSPAENLASVSEVDTGSGEVQVSPVNGSSAELAPGSGDMDPSPISSMSMSGGGETFTMMAGAKTMSIPNFAANPTIVSVRSGPWSSPSTWSENRVPKAGDRVMIGGDDLVTYDVASDEALDAMLIDDGGKLSFRTDMNTRLVIGTVMVMMDGGLEVGTPENPVSGSVTAEIVIADKALDTVDDGIGVYDPDQIGTGILGMGEVTIHGSELSSTFVRLAAEPRAGDRTLTLEAPVTGWRPGDRLVLPDSRQVYGVKGAAYDGLQWENPTISSVNGNTVTLTQPLRYNHPGARDADGKVVFMPHVGDLSRNVVIRSANPNGTRGHVMMMGRADVDIEYATFRDLGRTVWTTRVDTTVRDSAGNVVSIANNQIARYPLHMHFLMGPEQTPASGYQFSLVGNAIDGGDTPNTHRWGIDVHESHFGLIAGNVTYNTGGAGIGTEAGSETGNEFLNNFAVRTNGLGATDYDRISQGLNDFEHAGDGFWLSGPSNIVRGNVAADSIEAGFNLYQSEFMAQQYRVPLYKGASTSVEGQYKVVRINEMPFGEFSDNEAYTSTESGLHLRFVRGISNTATIRNTRVWNSRMGLFGDYLNPGVTLEGFEVVGDATKVTGASASTGMFMGTVAVGTRIADVKIQNVGTAIFAPNHVSSYYQQAVDQAIVFGKPYELDGTFTIDGATLRNNRTDIRVDNSRPAANATYDNQRILINDVSFSHTPTSDYRAIDAQLSTSLVNTDLRRRQEILVNNFDRVATDDFQVFYPQQAGNAVMPKSVGTMMGSPEAGLTNRQNWERYGIAIGGQVAPADAVARAGINGLVAPIAARPTGDDRPSTISDLKAVPNDDGSYTVTWRTDEPTDTRLYYGRATYLAPAGDDPLRLSTDHSVTIRGLAAGVANQITVIARDVAGNIASSTIYAGDTVAPVISNVQVRVTSPTSVVITWRTDEPSDSRVEYGATAAYGGVASDAALTTSHSVTLTGLNNSQVYQYRVGSQDPSGNASTSANSSFRIAAPVIANVRTTVLSQTSVKVSWTTDIPSDSRVSYGTTTGYGKVAYDQALVTEHSVTLTGLTYLTTFNYRVSSQDPSGNAATSDNLTFLTGAQPLVLTPKDAGYSETGGNWINNDSLGYRSHGSNFPAGAATWNFGALPAGRYKIYASWTPYINRATKAPYTVSDGSGVVGSVQMNQRLQPDDLSYGGQSYEMIGEFEIRGGAVSVTLRDGESNTVVLAWNMLLIPA
jgi:hypothetical protein